MTKNQLIAHIQLAKQEQWHELNLAQLTLTQLPRDIGQLDTLRVLYLYLNQLRCLPPEQRLGRAGYRQ